jgi:hypothetical protein
MGIWVTAIWVTVLLVRGLSKNPGLIGFQHQPFGYRCAPEAEHPRTLKKNPRRRPGEGAAFV